MSERRWRIQDMFKKAIYAYSSLWKTCKAERKGHNNIQIDIFPARDLAPTILISATLHITKISRHDLVSMRFSKQCCRPLLRQDRIDRGWAIRLGISRQRLEVTMRQGVKIRSQMGFHPCKIAVFKEVEVVVDHDMSDEAACSGSLTLGRWKFCPD